MWKIDCIVINFTSNNKRIILRKGYAVCTEPSIRQKGHSWKTIHGYFFRVPRMWQTPKSSWKTFNHAKISYKMNETKLLSRCILYNVRLSRARHHFFFCDNAFNWSWLNSGMLSTRRCCVFCVSIYYLDVCVYECAQFVVLRICEYYTALMATNETPFIQFKMMCVFVTFAYISVLNDKNVHLERANCKYENTKIKTQTHTHTEGERAREKKIQT